MFSHINSVPRKSLGGKTPYETFEFFYNKETLDKYGAVSSETVEEMLKGLSTDVGIAVSGIAGPLGGTEEKPVGTVYIGIKLNEELYINRHLFKGDRERIRIRACYTAINNLLQILRKRGM
jgi:nicotinamide-nucleotide amidase